MSDDAAAQVAATPTAAPLRWWLPALILCSGGLAYASSFGGVFLFDDEPWIVLNRDLHRLWPIWGAVSETLRPVVFFSFAVNYAISGLATWSWHLVNLAIHLLAALALFGVVRRSLSFASIPGHLREAADGIALAVAAIWVVHPLNTQAVTYIVQRSESLASLFYLLTLYCFLRGVQAGGARWHAASLAAFALGLGSKEIVATAPLLLLLYDRAFVTGSLRRSLRERWPVYGVFVVAPPALVLARWLAGLPTLYMFASAYASLTGQRRIPTVQGVKLAPLEPGAVTSLQYLMTQAEAVLHYIRLAVWPHPLVFDYMWPVARVFSQVALPALVVLGLLSATAWAARRHPRTGFVAAAFFLTLAVSSSVIPLADPVVEHRMYLPLAALVTLAVLAVWTGTVLGPFHAVPTNHAERCGLAPVPAARRRFAVLTLSLTIVVFGGVTFRRNLDYGSAEAMWRDVVEKRPQNARAHYNLGTLLGEDERVEAALASFTEAVRLDPGYAWAHTNLGVAHFRLGDARAARDSYETALRVDPRLSSAHNNLGMLLASRGEWGAAQRHFEAAIANIFDFTESVFARRPLLAYAHANLAMAFLERGDLEAARRNVKKALENDPELAAAHDVLGRVLAARGDLGGALDAYRRAIDLDPSLAVAHRNLAAALMGLVRHDEALAAYRVAIAIDPAVPAGHNDLGAALARLGRGTEAEASYRAALRLEPDFAEALNNLGLLLASRGDTNAALDSFRRAVAARPGYAEAYDNLGTTLADAGRTEEAVTAYLQALFARPDFARAHNNLAVALWKSGRVDDAVPHFREALRIRPDYSRARENLAKVLERR